MSNVNFKFDLYQMITIKPLERPGRVLAIFMDGNGPNGVQYNIRYFDNAEARTVYFFEDELE